MCAKEFCDASDEIAVVDHGGTQEAQAGSHNEQPCVHVNEPLMGDITEVLRVVDRLEDQVDDIAYKELVPLHIKLALEDQVFGWSNMFSSFMGHTVITLLAYQLTYVALSCIPWEIHNAWMTNSIQTLLSLWAAIGAFRMVRRRRHVWFRAAYGSKEYRMDAQRRQTEVAETDSSTLLGRIRRHSEVYLKGRVVKKLHQAENMFDTWKQKKAKRRRPSFQTFPTYETKSIENDQVLFGSGPIKKMPYSHGCFFGAAPFMLANPDWISILRHLMPDVYVEISRRVLRAPTPKLIHWAENNPVVAAYGTANELANTGRIINLEWDVFLEPRLVRRVELVLDQRETLLASYGGAQGKWTPEQRSILEFLDAELERRSIQLVDKMLIAHGKLSQLILEQTGFGKDYNYYRIARTRRTLGGGMYARQWVAVYAEALRLGMQMSESFRDITEETTREEEVVLSDDGLRSDGIPHDRILRTESCPLLVESFPHFQSDIAVGVTCLSSLTSSKCPNTSIAESVELLKRVTKKARPIGLVLDMKSRHVPKRIWSIVVNVLNSAEAWVEAVASFTIDEIRDISRLCSRSTLEIIFCHSAGDMQKGCHDGAILPGDNVFINGGSLLWEPPVMTADYVKNVVFGDFDPIRAMSQYRLLPFTSTSADDAADNTLKAYKERLNLKLGLYVQEFGIDDAALDILVAFVNENQSLFEHGLSWGGINGVTVRGIRPDRWTPTDGFSTQRYAGLAWDSSKQSKDVPLKRRLDN